MLIESHTHFYIKFHLYDNFVWIDSFSDISPTWNPVFRKDIGIFWLADVADWKPIIERANIPPNLIKSRENIFPFLHLTHNLSCHIFFWGIQKIRIITFWMKRKRLLVCNICVIHVSQNIKLIVSIEKRILSSSFNRFNGCNLEVGKVASPFGPVVVYLGGQSSYYLSKW